MSNPNDDHIVRQIFCIVEHNGGHTDADTVWLLMCSCGDRFANQNDYPEAKIGDRWPGPHRDEDANE